MHKADGSTLCTNIWNSVVRKCRQNNWKCVYRIVSLVILAGLLTLTVATGKYYRTYLQKI